MADLIGQKLGQYEITALLGEGGMAAVYRARQLNIKRDVAVKVIESKLAHNPEFVKRFEREAQTIATPNHPHILKLFDYGQYENLIYYGASAGGSLADLIRKRMLLLEQVSRLREQIASALDYAHAQGIIHRDLKPQNVLLDPQGNAILTDFGIAKVLNETTALTASGMSMGTPRAGQPGRSASGPSISLSTSAQVPSSIQETDALCPWSCANTVAAGSLSTRCHPRNHSSSFWAAAPARLPQKFMWLTRQSPTISQ
jgi:serine/threonine protein kinase